MLKRIDAAPRKKKNLFIRSHHRAQVYTLRFAVCLQNVCNTRITANINDELNCAQNKNKRTKKPASQLRTQLNDCEMKRAAES